MASQYRRRSLMLNTIAKVAQGNPTIITDSSSRRLQKLNIYGQSSQDGTPSVENPIPIISKEVSEIKVTGANLIEFPFYSGTKVVKGITFTVNDDQSITINGTNDGTGDSVIEINMNIRFKKGDAISTGLLSDKDDANVYVNAFYIGGIGTNSKKENIIVDNDSKNYDILLSVKLGATIDNVTVKFMRNYGPTLLPYEPYKSQSITLSEPITLRGIPVSSGGNITIDGQQYISDVITEKDGVIGVERNIIDLSASEDIVFTQTSDRPNRTRASNAFNIPTSIKSGDKEALSTHFVWKAWSQGNNNKEWLFSVNLRSLYISPPAKEVNYTKEEIESLVNGEWAKIKNDVKFYAQLSEPTFDPLPDEIQTQYKALKSYYPNTVINTGCWNEVTYSAKRGG